MTVSIKKSEFLIITEALICFYHIIKRGKKIREFENNKMQNIKNALNKIANANDKYECPKTYRWCNYAAVLDSELVQDALSVINEYEEGKNERDRVQRI